MVFFPLSSPSLLSAAAFLDDTFEAVVVFAGFFAALEGLATFGLAFLLSLVFCFFFSFNAIFSLVAGFLFCGSTAFSWGDESEGRTAGTDIFVGLLVFLLSEALFPESIVFVFSVLDLPLTIGAKKNLLLGSCCFYHLRPVTSFRLFNMCVWGLSTRFPRRCCVSCFVSHL